jgi:hypothetical protein
MDGDGLQDEDEIGGVDINRNYASHWSGGDHNTRSPTYGGPSVWSEPESRAIRDFVKSHDHIAAALTIHSGVDLILHPWGWSADAVLPDAEMYELLSAKGSELTHYNGYYGAKHAWTGRGLYPGWGSAMDYLYEDRGIFAWTPEIYGSDMLSRVQRVGATGTYSVGMSLAFAYNPPPDGILPAVERWHRFTEYVFSATPNVELSGVTVADGRLNLFLGNDGILPVQVEVSAEGVEGQRIQGVGPERNLQGYRTAWTFPLDDLRKSGNRIEAVAVLQSGTVPHEVERQAWVITISENEVTVDDGVVRPFRMLGEEFGGWWSAPEWSNWRPAQDTHIDAVPPVTPTSVYVPIFNLGR